MKIKWTKATSVGDATLDSQHEKLMGKINNFLSLKIESNDQIVGLLDFLVEHAEIHFKYEEKYMLMHNFPYYKKHLVLHDQFIEHIEQFKKRLLSSKTSNIVIAVKKFLTDWWQEHILGFDQEYEDYIAAHPKCHPISESHDFHTKIQI